ncbi:hypothetical protein [Prevotella sp. KH2C16]|uniref:hypothetical protein n=1 Tax=Prevotella sp. KH2C16 TaxID=1855325 RepID=UPI0008E7550A|nr:hypothetical protein [Prevotella sp. KH2C16]SFG57069.1 hypothetical protein SAMN05216383_12079 [Prevotella sp. KH2C16]
MDKDKQLELDIADTIIDRPKGFSVGRRHFYLYPVTLGKMHLQQRVTESLDLNKELLQVSPYAEALRLVETKKEECCLLLAYHTLQTKKEVLSNRTVTIRKNIFLREMDNEDIATLILACLTNDKTTLFIQHFGIDKEIERMSEIAKAKESKNTFSFGGKSIYGTLIDAACERYKWTFDYVLWEISYTNLMLLMKDKVTSLYLTDEEMKKIHINNISEFVDGNSKAAVMNAIQGMSWK